MSLYPRMWSLSALVATLYAASASTLSAQAPRGGEVTVDEVVKLVEARVATARILGRLGEPCSLVISTADTDRLATAGADSVLLDALRKRCRASVDSSAARAAARTVGTGSSSTAGASAPVGTPAGGGGAVSGAADGSTGSAKAEGAAATPATAATAAATSPAPAAGEPTGGTAVAGGGTPEPVSRQNVGSLQVTLNSCRTIDSNVVCRLSATEGDSIASYRFGTVQAFTELLEPLGIARLRTAIPQDSGGVLSVRAGQLIPIVIVVAEYDATKNKTITIRIQIERTGEQPRFILFDAVALTAR